MNTHNPIESLRALHEFINDDYCGDYLAMERKMSEIIYLLHYLPEETFGGKRVQDTVLVLDRLRESFRSAQTHQQAG